MTPNKTPCKRLPKGTSKEDLKTLHKMKMMGKFFRNQDPEFHKAGFVNNHKGVI